MGVDEIRQYLSHLATEGHVSASTQNQALSALLFVYREMLRIDLPFIDGIEKAKRPARVPGVPTREETSKILARLSGVCHLMVSHKVSAISYSYAPGQPRLYIPASLLS